MKAFAKHTECSENLLRAPNFPCFLMQQIFTNFGDALTHAHRPYKASQNKSVLKFHHDQPQTLPYKSRESREAGHKCGQSRGLHPPAVLGLLSIAEGLAQSCPLLTRMNQG